VERVVARRNMPALGDPHATVDDADAQAIAATIGKLRAGLRSEPCAGRPPRARAGGELPRTTLRRRAAPASLSERRVQHEIRRRPAP
jgi:hypothetical protein